MRPGAESPMAHGPASASASPRSPWQSPVPYLFGGLAAMLGLIALSLLALACSYWKLSGGLAGPGGGDQQADGAAEGEKGSAAGDGTPGREWQVHVVVIMAGDERPTFLATPASSRAADGVDDPAPSADVAASCSCAGGISEEAKTAESEASAQLAGSEDDARRRSEQTSGVLVRAGSVIS